MRLTNGAPGSSDNQSREEDPILPVPSTKSTSASSRSRARGSWSIPDVISGK
jgi:hypothetical protein